MIPAEAVEAEWAITSKADDGWVWLMDSESEARNAVRENTKLVHKVNDEWVDAE